MFVCLQFRCAFVVFLVCLGIVGGCGLDELSVIVGFDDGVLLLFVLFDDGMVLGWRFLGAGWCLVGTDVDLVLECWCFSWMIFFNLLESRWIWLLTMKVCVLRSILRKCSLVVSWWVSSLCCLWKSLVVGLYFCRLLIFNCWRGTMLVLFWI